MEEQQSNLIVRTALLAVSVDVVRALGTVTHASSADGVGRTLGLSLAERPQDDLLEAHAVHEHLTLGTDWKGSDWFE